MMAVFIRSSGMHFRPVIRTLSSSGTAVHLSDDTRTLFQSQRNVIKIQSRAPAAGLFKCLGGVRAIRIRGVHDQRKKGDDELLGFLEQEIITEKKLLRSISIPTTLEGFTVKLDKSDITLTKKDVKEQIIISANVNHSVDTEPYRGGSVDPSVNQRSKEPARMRSRPNFIVEIKKGKHALCFHCSFLPNEEQIVPSQDEIIDIFFIGELSFCEGDAKVIDYAVAGDILDGHLYDLFMNLLEARGINNELVEKFSDLCTDYEHNLYIEFLTNLQKFFK